MTYPIAPGRHLSCSVTYEETTGNLVVLFQCGSVSKGEFFKKKESTASLRSEFESQSVVVSPIFL